MPSSFKIFRRAILLALPMVALAFSSSGRAEAYPDKPIRIIVGFGPGSGADTMPACWRSGLQSS
jgi:tripartite-type tricarboxylate transporter receptor subunit TctC